MSEVAKYSHVMLDLETLGLNPGCAIVELGAVAFNFGNDMMETIHHMPSIQSNEKFGLIKEQQTMEWWYKQSNEEFGRIFRDDNKEDLSAVLYAFFKWFQQKEAKYIWCQGANFDIPVIEAAFKRVGIATTPWKYNNVRDTRTMYWLAGLNVKDVPFDGIPHRAVHDALHQIKCLRLSKDKLANDFDLAGLDL